MTLESRIIVATVGLQPAAVLAPLLSPPLRPRRLDHVVLVATGETQHWIAPINARVGGLTNRGADSLVADASGLSPGAARRLADASAGHETWLLANGAPWPLVRSVIEAVTGASRLRLVASRDHRATIFDLAGGAEEFPVADVGRAELLRFLNLEFENGVLKGRGAGPSLPNVTRLLERAGQLYAALNLEAFVRDQNAQAASRRSFQASGQPTARRGRPAEVNALQAYRETALDVAMLATLGLERRRVLVCRVNEVMQDRCRGDGVPVATKGLSVRSWSAEVLAGTAIDIPERQLEQAPGPVPAPRSGVGGWSGPPLLTTVGTEPATTLLGIWGARPRTLILLYDGFSPQSRHLTGRFAVEATLGCEELRCMELRHLAAFDPPPGSLVDERPGDKVAKLAVWRWWRDHPEVKPLVHASTEVPLDLWTRMHAPAKVTFRERPATDRSLVQAARGALWSAGVLDPHRGAEGNPQRGEPDLDVLASLNNLAERGTPPRLVGGALEYNARDGALVRWDPSPWPEIAADIASVGGRWFEAFVECVLADVADEVLPDVRCLWPARDGQVPSGSAFRDQLDVVTRCGTVYVLWSCKTSAKTADDDLREARGQAVRLLGRRARAVLAIPRNRRVPNGAREVGPGHVSVPGVGDIVDGRILGDRRLLDPIARRVGVDANPVSRRSPSRPRR